MILIHIKPWTFLNIFFLCIHINRKNRNMHAEVLLHMLKKGSLDGIFTQRPESGPLPPLPAYMVISK